MIEVVPYQTEWPRQYEAEASTIKTALGDNLVAIHHVGSTAIPGLAAKPKIDIIAQVKNGEEAITSLEKAGYEHRGEWNIPFKFGFRRREKVSVNLHLFEEDHPEIELNLRFRDYLRSHDDAREEYGKLKNSLLQDERSQIREEGKLFTGYTLGKHEFIKRILKKSGWEGLRFLKCSHHDEWKAAKAFRLRYFFQKEDPYTWTFDHEDHCHFVLSSATEIVGYAHIQLWPKRRAAVRIIVIDEKYRGCAFGGKFMGLIERWLKKEGYKSVHAEASPDAYAFYCHLGYSDMPFDDPDGYEGGPDDIDVGKSLQ